LANVYGKVSAAQVSDKITPERLTPEPLTATSKIKKLRVTTPLPKPARQAASKVVSF